MDIRIYDIEARNRENENHRIYEIELHDRYQLEMKHKFEGIFRY